MKVIDVFNKVDDLKLIQGNLKHLHERLDPCEYDTDVLTEAIEAIDSYIFEFMKKDVKE